MPNIFKKITKGANRIFNKIESGSNNFFKKTIPDIAGKVGSGFEDFGNKVADTAVKAGNWLEKNAGVVSDGVAGALYATGFGAPLATAVLTAGNTAQQVGSRIKKGGKDAQQGLNNLAGQINKQSTLLSNKGLQAVQQGKQQIINTANNAMAQANQQVNQLKAAATDSANNALAQYAVA
jgi:soluble cytochrome b562